jgi:hypothetical protein
MTMTCERGDCSATFEQKRKGQRFCSAHCAVHALRPWERSTAARSAAARQRRLEGVQGLDEDKRQAYARGYQAARYQYHYRKFLRDLNALLADSGSFSDAAGQLGSR